MKRLHFALFCVVSTVLAGCATREPLLNIASESRATVRFSPPIKSEKAGSLSTVSGRNHREVMSYGLLGVAVGATAIAFSDESAKDLIPAIREATGPFESTLVQERFRAKLAEVGVQITTNHSHPVLSLEITQFGVREVQRGFFAPYLFARAKLTNLEGKHLWDADAHSVGTKLRRKEEFQRQPELYRNDFIEIADDLSRQLIQGPVRALPR